MAGSARFHHDCRAVGQHLGHAVGDVVGVVTHGDDGVGRMSVTASPCIYLPLQALQGKHEIDVTIT